MMNMANRNGDAKQLAGNVERMKHLFSLIIVLTALSFTSVVLAQRTIRIGEGNFTAPYFYIVLIIHLVISLWAMQGLEGMASC